MRAWQLVGGGLKGAVTEAVTLWSPESLQEEDPECNWEPNTWYFESAGCMGWMPVHSDMVLYWSGGPAKTKEELPFFTK